MVDPQVASRRKPASSLAFRVGMLIIALIAVVLLVFLVVFVITERQKTTADILKNGKTFALFTAEPIYEAYARLYDSDKSSDFTEFKNRVQENYFKHNTDIEHISLIAQDGRVLFDSNEFVDGKYTGATRKFRDESTLQAVQSRKTQTQELTDTGSRQTAVIVPVSGGHSMRFVIGYSSVTGQMQDSYRRIAVAGLLLLPFVVLAVWFFVRQLTQPIIRLTRVAEQIRVGNLAARAAVGSNDEIGRLAQTVNDMTERLGAYYKSLEAKVQERTKALEAAHTQLLQNVKQDEALLASIGDGVIATDKSGHLIWMNKPAEDMLQVSKERVLGKTYDEVWRLETDKGESIKAEEQPIYEAYKSGKPVRNSAYSYVRRDASGKILVKFAVAVTVAPVTLNDQVIGIINVFRDITQERQVDRMKTEFISLASHQLRTPLSAIRWFTEMLLNGDAGELTPEQHEFSKNIYDSVDRMIELVNSLLNISRIESGRIIVEPKPTDLAQLVGGVVNDLKAKTEQKQQNLIVSVHKDLPKVNLDPHLIGQVYMNFLTNAIKYTPKGGEISVFISRKGEELVSQVTDNGYGIPKSQHDRVFQKFFRAENIIKVETDGTGLGLYLVKAIIESSGGRVWFDSQEGKGTTFWFTLPMSGMKAKAGEVTLDA